MREPLCAVVRLCLLLLSNKKPYVTKFFNSSSWDVLPFFVSKFFFAVLAEMPELVFQTVR